MRSLRPKRPSNAKRSTSNNLNSNMLRFRSDDVWEKYEVVKNIGEGSMGSISKAKIRDDKLGGSAYKPRKFGFCGCFGFFLGSARRSQLSGPSSMREGRRDGEIYYALKTIVMSRISPEFIGELRNEIDILRRLDHPNIVKAFEVYENKNQFFIVMELCAGGDLYRHLPYSEKDAACITAKICSAIAYMHGKLVVHRDLKFENIMFETTASDSEIKIIDFGLSKKFSPKDSKRTMTEGVGTIYTMAPQVLQGIYTSQADLWSLGVISFMLLASQKPFKGRKRREVVNHIMRCDYSFDSEIWNTLSSDSIDFVRHLLVLDAEQRMDAKAALKHRWLTNQYNLSDRRPDEELMRKVEDNLLAYKHTSALKKVALNVIARKSTPREIYQLRKAFGQFDIENDGTISFEEFKEALKQSNYSDKELEEIFNSIDVNAIGHIMYTEFIAATLEVKGSIEEERIAEAFDRLDSDESGYISPKDLRELLVEYSESEIEALIAEADTDKDGQISFEEFKKIFCKQTETLAAKALSSRAFNNESTLGESTKLPEEAAAISKS